MKNSDRKKNLQKTVSDQLLTVLSGLKDHLGEKKFQRRIKKASKMLVSGIKETTKKKEAATHKKSTKLKKKAILIPATNESS
jgi:hypothetical protein